MSTPQYTIGDAPGSAPPTPPPPVGASSSAYTIGDAPGGGTPTAGSAPAIPGFTQISSPAALTDKAYPSEGTYAMTGPQGQQQIPFSQVDAAKKQGWKFAGQPEFNPWYLVPGSSKGTQFRLTPEEKRYNSDAIANTSHRIAQEMLSTPGGRAMVEGDGMDLVLGGAKEIARDAIGLHDIAAGKPGAGTQKSALRQFSEEPNQNLGESLGGAIETTGEFMTGEGAILEGTKLISRLTKVLGYVPKLAEAAKIEQEIQKGTTYGKILQQALLQGTVGGAQQYVKTGGDVGEAAKAAALTAGGTALIGGGAKALGDLTEAGQEAAAARQAAKAGAVTDNAAQAAQTEAAQTYGKTAGQAIEPHLRAIEEAGQGRPITMNQPGGEPGVVAGTTRPITNFNTDEVLSRVGDYTGARDSLQSTLNQTTDAIDEATGGRFKALNQEVKAAKDQAYATGSSADKAAYKQKLNQLDDLIASSQNVRPDLISALRNGWRQYYVMDELTTRIDRAVEGLPGDTSVSQAQRGINGKVGMKQLSDLILDHGRPTVAAAVGGEERLNTLEQVFKSMSTRNGQKSVNEAVVNVAKYMKRSPAMETIKHLTALGAFAATSAATGSGYGSYLASAAAGAAVEGVPYATRAATRAVQNALLANPKAAKMLLYVAKTGARPGVYGPMIAAMINQSNRNKEEQQ